MTGSSKISVLATIAVCMGIAMPAAENAIDTNSIAAAERLFGLEFSASEREMMAPSLNERLDAYQRLRKESFPNELTPSMVFNPLPVGFEVPAERKHPRWKPPRGIKRPQSDDELAWMSVAELSALIRTKQITSEELTRLSLDRLRKHGPKLFCVVTLTEERALEEARRADAEMRAGKWRGPLHGIPYAAKDLIDTRGIRTTWGVSLYTNRIPDSDATVVRKLSEAGAVLVAKTSLGELAMGEVWYGGKTRNPWNLEKGSSGSSAGSTAAVAAGLVPFAIGSETMGSIVSPVTTCGVSGLRPSFGRVSRAGAMTLSWSLDKLGPIARTIEDCALVLDAMRGADPNDPSTRDAAFNWTDKRPLRVGYVKKNFEGSDRTVTNDLATLQLLRSAGFGVREVEWPKIPQPPLWLMLSAEDSAAFDELTRSNLDDKLVQQESWSWPNSFRSARFIPAVEYIQATRLRTRLIAEMAKLFSEVDVIVAPTWRGPQMLYSNMAGYPCATVPNADRTGGEPAGICFLAGLYREGDAIRVAQTYQRLTDFHRRRPSGY